MLKNLLKDLENSKAFQIAKDVQIRLKNYSKSLRRLEMKIDRLQTDIDRLSEIHHRGNNGI